jgi:predicted nucleotidyltransferase
VPLSASLHPTIFEGPVAPKPNAVADRKGSSVKQFLQRLALRTQFFPFTWFYGALYGLAVSWCVRRLKRIAGVRSIYLRRGLATGRPVYGLSDIDLLVMVESEGHELAAARVRYQYELLRRAVPMLPQGELWLYYPQQFLELYEWVPFYRNRFHQGRQEWRRLFGEDLFADLPPVREDERWLAWEELHPAWYYLAQVLLPDDPRPSYVKRYVAYKMIAEAARAALVAKGADPGIPRETALVIATEEFQELAANLKEIQSWRKDLLGTKPIAVAALLDTFLGLARRALKTASGEGQFRCSLRIPPVDPEELTRFLPDGAVQEIQEACKFLPEVERAVFVPRLSFDAVAVSGMDLEALTGATTDSYDLVLMGPRLPSIEKLRQFNLALERFRPTVNLFFGDSEIALALRPIQSRTLKTAGHDPEFFVGLASSTPWEGILELGGAAEVDRPFARRDSLQHRGRSLLGLFRQPEVFRLPTRSFFALFWEAGRAACLAEQSGRQAIEVPVSSQQVLETLAGLTPWAEPALRQVYQGYLSGITEGASEAVRYVHWAAGYAAELEERLFPGTACRLGIPIPVRNELTISVMIVTRNRAGVLRAALQSLVAQERQADQVVVVDNASTDDTAVVARSFAGQLNVTLVREEKIGIPYARNTALRYCTGDIVAVMDDDCVAKSRWLAEIEIPFLKDPHIGAVGGSILPQEEQSELVARFYRSRMHMAEEAREKGPKR